MKSNFLCRLSSIIGCFPPEALHSSTKLSACTSCHNLRHYSLLCFLLSLAYGPMIAIHVNARGKDKNIQVVRGEMLDGFKAVKATACCLCAASHFYQMVRHRKYFLATWHQIGGMGCSPSNPTLELAVFTLLTVVRIGFTAFGFACCEGSDVRIYSSFMVELSLTIVIWFDFVILLQFCTALDRLSQMLACCNRALQHGSVRIAPHANVILVAYRLNDLYGVQIFCSSGAFFLELVSSTFFVVSDAILLTRVKRLPAKLLAYFCIDSLSFAEVLIGLLTLARHCSATKILVDAFYKELFRLMRESKTLCTNKKLCLYVSMKKTVTFTACGFFNIGYPLITSIIAAATTYLVILVQFSIPSS